MALQYRCLTLVLATIVVFASFGIAVHAQSIDSLPPPRDSSLHQDKSPTNAVMYSLLFPGAGQFYVESYIKAPVFAAAAAGLYYSIAANHVFFSDKIQEIENAVAIGTPESQLSLMRAQREQYRDRRDLSGLWLLGVYVVSAVDAYVGAHLFSFDVSDRLSLQWRPDPINNGVVISLAGVGL